MNAIFKSILALFLVSFQSFGASKSGELYDWMICIGGYRFENEDKLKQNGFEISYLPEPYFGFVLNVDIEGNSYTRNVGLEVIGNALFLKLLRGSDLGDNYFIRHVWVFFPGVELGGSFNAQNEIGLHTSIFLNFVIMHPYVDYNIYQDRIDRKFGVKWKVGFGPWFIDAAVQ